MRFCATPGCPATVPKGHCRVHAAQREQGRSNADVRRLYHTQRWRRLRAQILGVDPLCAACLTHGRCEPATDVDHVVPHRGSQSLFWDASNLEALCHACHSTKTQRGE